MKKIFIIFLMTVLPFYTATASAQDRSVENLEEVIGIEGMVINEYVRDPREPLTVPEPETSIPLENEYPIIGESDTEIYTEITPPPVVEVVPAPSAQTQIESNTVYSGEVTQTDTNSIHSGVDIINDLGEATDMRVSMKEAGKASAGIKKLISIIVQILAYVIIFGLVLRVVIDLTYIGLPFSRGILANNFQGAASTTPGGPSMGGMHRPFGHDPTGSFGGYRRPGLDGRVNIQKNAAGRLQLVSNAALNAVAAESTPGPDGRPSNPFKLYVKDMIVVLVITPIILVLVISGVLTQLGFIIGEILVRAISNFGGQLNV